MEEENSQIYERYVYNGKTWCIIKEEISEYNEKLLKYSAADDFAKIGELEKDIRSDVELFFGDLSKILESIKNKY